MVYTDKIHIVADSLDELHAFALKAGISRSYYHGIRKGHPHYDITSRKRFLRVKELGVIILRPREILEISKKCYEKHGVKYS